MTVGVDTLGDGVTFGDGITLGDGVTLGDGASSSTLLSLSLVRSWGGLTCSCALLLIVGFVGVVLDLRVWFCRCVELWYCSRSCVLSWQLPQLLHRLE